MQTITATAVKMLLKYKGLVAVMPKGQYGVCFRWESDWRKVQADHNPELECAYCGAYDSIEEPDGYSGWPHCLVCGGV